MLVDTKEFFHALTLLNTAPLLVLPSVEEDAWVEELATMDIVFVKMDGLVLIVA